MLTDVSFLGGSLTKVAYVSTFSRKRPKHQTWPSSDKADDLHKVRRIRGMTLNLHVCSSFLRTDAYDTQVQKASRISAVHRSRSTGAGAGVLAYFAGDEPEFVQLRQNSSSTYFVLQIPLDIGKKI